jgi:hypothetical protein
MPLSENLQGKWKLVVPMPHIRHESIDAQERLGAKDSLFEGLLL